MYAKADPDKTFVDIEKQLRVEGANVYLIALVSTPYLHAHHTASLYFTGEAEGLVRELHLHRPSGEIGPHLCREVLLRP